MRWTDRALLLVRHLDLPAATGFENARWEHFQLAHLCDNSTFRAENKSRQIAWSWTVAVEAVADAVLTGRGTLFGSINEEEAKEKKRYARTVYDNLQLAELPRIVKDNDLNLEFDNGARLISFPAKPIRGKAGMNVVLDEFAHVQHDRAIYTGSLPVISKGGRLRIGSSPMGASGMFWEIFDQEHVFTGYTRKKTPWWEVQAFCTDVATARKLAPTMPTAQRVARFGTPRLQMLYGNMVEEDFRQEYETEFVDESTAWITWEELRAAQELGEGLVCLMAAAKGSNVTPAIDAIEALKPYIRSGKVESALSVGVDIGRTRNLTEIFLVGISSTESYPLRLAISLDNMEFDDQLHVLIHVLKELPITKMLIDQTGIGRNLAESVAKKFRGKAEGVDFTNATKQLWATDAKMLIQQKKTPLPTDREIANQIHSIKRMVTASKNLVFDTERNEKHHADKFWAWALALAGAHQPGGKKAGAWGRG